MNLGCILCFPLRRLPPRPSPQTLCMALNAASEVLVTSVRLPHRTLSQVYIITLNANCRVKTRHANSVKQYRLVVCGRGHRSNQSSLEFTALNYF